TLFFGNIDYFSERVQELVAHAPHPVRCLVLDLVSVGDIDYTAGQTLPSIVARFKRSGIRVALAQADAIRDQLRRQLDDLKGAAPVEHIVPSGLRRYASLCGRTLAREHARSGDRIEIASYLGSSARFDEALAAFAEAYADQNDADYQALVTAHKQG